MHNPKRLLQTKMVFSKTNSFTQATASKGIIETKFISLAVWEIQQMKNYEGKNVFNRVPDF